MAKTVKRKKSVKSVKRKEKKDWLVSMAEEYEPAVCETEADAESTAYELETGTLVAASEPPANKPAAAKKALPARVQTAVSNTADSVQRELVFNLNKIQSDPKKKRRAKAHGVVGLATAAGVAIAAIPLPYPDAALLAPTEALEINALANIYGMRKGERSTTLINSILDAGAVTLAGKSAISALKAIPGINIGATVLNAIVAGSIIAALGEGSIFIFESINRGERSADDVDWVRKMVESKLTGTVIQKATQAVKEVGSETDLKKIAKIVADTFLKKST
ncbi:MAG: DUF697 domain-containing protein [Firmicutes bacterium]|nr:DUF697 domain-containing protein [Bacillota bacterium]